MYSSSIAEPKNAIELFDPGRPWTSPAAAQYALWLSSIPFEPTHVLRIPDESPATRNLVKSRKLDIT